MRDDRSRRIPRPSSSGISKPESPRARYAPLGSPCFWIWLRLAGERFGSPKAKLAFIRVFFWTSVRALPRNRPLGPARAGGRHVSLCVVCCLFIQVPGASSEGSKTRRAGEPRLLWLCICDLRMRFRSGPVWRGLAVLVGYTLLLLLICVHSRSPLQCACSSSSSVRH